MASILRTLALAAPLMSLGCTVPALDLAGKACDADHPCGAGYSCAAAKCIASGTSADAGACVGDACQPSCTGCLIDATCYPDATLNPENPCQRCDSARSLSAWSNSQAGTSCPDEPNACTTDTCDAAGTCLHAPVADGTSCGDGLVCAGGICRAGCFIDGNHFASGALDPINSCQACDPVRDPLAWSSLPINAPCLDDGDPCTSDTCNSVGSCRHRVLADGTSCSATGVCSAAACKDGCYIAGSFHPSGTFNSGNSCQLCDPSNDKSSWKTLTSSWACGFNDAVSCVTIAPNRQRLVGGSFTTWGGKWLPHAARFAADGSLDSSFAATGQGLNGTVTALAIDGSGRTVVGGGFASYNGTSRPHVARLNADGSLDSSFAPTGTGLDNNVSALAIDGSGRVVVGGRFTAYGGTPRPFIARLNADGSLDSSFAPTGSGLNNRVEALAIDESGRIFVGGLFTAYSGTARPYFARLNADGSLDSSFAPAGSGLNGDVKALAIDGAGRIAVGGLFTAYSGTPRPFIARLNADG
ncbi:MAG: delta-60 repeat domain-containing protein, partial [Deltaproteobacteria bacterium]|nr:delta-60 repeat domain-containing protein [Deltaproteobacteria bacterium]